MQPRQEQIKHNDAKTNRNNKASRINEQNTKDVDKRIARPLNNAEKFKEIVAKRSWQFIIEIALLMTSESASSWIMLNNIFTHVSL